MCTRRIAEKPGNNFVSHGHQWIFDKNKKRIAYQKTTQIDNKFDFQWMKIHWKSQKRAHVKAHAVKQIHSKRKLPECPKKITLTKKVGYLIRRSDEHQK